MQSCINSGRRTWIALATGAVAFVSNSAAFGQFGGLAFPEQGGPISGTAQAGQVAVARDAATAWLNPAGLTRLENFELLSAVQIINLKVEFDSDPRTTTTGSDGGDAGDWVLGGSLYMAVPLGDRFTFGASVTAPYGLPLDYKSDWVGRYFATELELLVLNIEPAIGFKINDWLSVGAGLDFQYADFEQDVKVPIGGTDFTASIHGDNWEVGASIGVLIEPSESTRFGLRYRTEMDHSLDGDLQTIGSLSTSASLTIPQSLTFSAYHELNEQWALMADVGWTDWSAFARTRINIDTRFATPIEKDIPRNWDDTWNVGFGAHYRFAEDWLLMSGVSYVSSAVDDKDRTPDIPVDEQWRISFGLEHQTSAKFRWGLTYTFAYLGDNDIDATNLAGRVVGDYDTPLHMIGLYGAWTF